MPRRDGSCCRDEGLKLPAGPGRFNCPGPLFLFASNKSNQMLCSFRSILIRFSFVVHNDLPKVFCKTTNRIKIKISFLYSIYFEKIFLNFCSVSEFRIIC